MIELYVALPDESHVKLDIDQNETITLTKQLMDLKEITTRRGDFTRQFMLPATQTNIDFFGKWYDPGYQGTKFSQYARTPCLLFESGSLILNGNLSLLSFHRDKRIYEIVIYGTLNLLANILREKTMDEIAGASLWNHTHDLTNIIASWSLGIVSGKVVYPLIDYGYGYGYGGWTITNAANPVQVHKTPPALKLVELIHDVFVSNGLVLGNYTELQSTLQSIFMQLIEEIPVGNPANDSFNAVYDEAMADTPIPTVETKIPFTSPNPYFDNPNHEYTAPYTGTYFFSIRILSGSGNPGYTNTWIFYVNSVAQITANVSQSNAEFNNDWQTSLTAGDICWWTMITSVANPLNKIVAGAGDFWNLAYVQTTDLVPAYYNPILMMNNLKQKDFLKAIQETFNMIIVPDQEDQYKFYFRFLEDWYEEGVRKNWSEIWDKSKETVISPTNELIKRNVNMQWKDSEDYLNKFFRDEYGFNYGTYQGDLDISNAEEFVQKSKLFAPYPTDYLIDRPDIFIAKWLKSYTEISLQKPSGYQLFFYNGVGTSGNYFIRYGSSGGASLMSTWPRCANFQLIGGNVTYISKDINFGYSPPFANTWTITGIPRNNIFKLFWEKYFQELYNPLNRILDINFKLTPTEVAEIQFNDIIAIDMEGSPQFWRIQKINNYLTRRITSTKCQMTKAYIGAYPMAELLMDIRANGSQIVDRQDKTPVTNNGFVTQTLLGRRIIYNDGSSGNYLYYPGLDYSMRNHEFPFTVMAWVEFSSLSEIFLLNKGFLPSDLEFQVTIFAENIYFIIYDDSSNYVGRRASIAGWGTEWRLVTITYDGDGYDDDAGMKIYVNGVLQTTISISTGTFYGIARYDTPRTGELWSGTNYSGAFRMDRLRFFTKEMDILEMGYIYGNERNKYGV
ncbi:hypothetical protein AMJ86_00830 [bacterium SM23_57]|nr:MAG: hypothetical protein AMJ86_00830 [bacterium SM23_57]